jgi:carboxyl-terminal processing protease
MRRFLLFCLLFSGSTGFSAGTAQADYGERFDTAWELVSERYWNTNYGGADWPALRLAYRPRALAARNDQAFYRVLEALYSELGDRHSVFVPPAKVQQIRAAYGDLPCLGVFGRGVGGRSERLGPVRYRLDGTVGIVTLPDLATVGVSQDLRRVVRRLTERGATAFVLDLRGNPGGRLVEMMQATGVFARGFLWRTVTRWTLPIPYPAIGPVETELPLAVLIDRDVNSAAEGLAGALQSSGRARVFGETSAGNVEAVLPFCLRDGSQAWIATGVLAPLRGATWEGRGVVPDEPSRRALRDALDYLRSR